MQTHLAWRGFLTCRKKPRVPTNCMQQDSIITSSHQCRTLLVAVLHAKKEEQTLASCMYEAVVQHLNPRTSQRLPPQLTPLGTHSHSIALGSYFGTALQRKPLAKHSKVPPISFLIYTPQNHHPSSTHPAACPHLLCTSRSKRTAYSYKVDRSYTCTCSTKQAQWQHAPNNFPKQSPHGRQLSRISTRRTGSSYVPEPLSVACPDQTCAA